jgi:prepilin-type processing-associated H-X9-DG protein
MKPITISNFRSWIRNVAGFTLVELLLVLACVAILSGLLLPSLAKSKTSAHRVKCVSNLHQLGLATHMYWDDNAGNCFRYGGTPVDGGQLYWFGWIGPGAEGQRAFDATHGVLYPYLKERGIDVCPAFNYSSPEVKLKAFGATYGYGYNVFLSAAPREQPIKTGNLPRPASTALFADAAQVNTWQAPASPEHPMLEEWYYIDTSSNQPNGHFRHSRRANVLFCDQHVAPEQFMPGSIDSRMPNQIVARFRQEVLRLP